ncbi:hypothetical protein NQZ68_025944 [Dissostichus eleginoides]|nr:hypothetical protein NQZ68_025944 [Dissostichus eleginoides]
MQFRDQTTVLTPLKQLRDVNSVRGTKAMVAVGRIIIFGASQPDRGATTAMAVMAAVKFLPLSSEKEQQQPDPVTNKVEPTASSPAPASHVYPDLSPLKKPPPYEPLSPHNPFSPHPPNAIQAPTFKVKSGYLEMEESIQKPLLEAMKKLSSVNTSVLTDLQRSNQHMISMANRLSTLEDSLMLTRLPSPVVTQNGTTAPDNDASAQGLSRTAG